MTEILNYQEKSAEQQELLELGRKLFELVQKKLGDSKEITLGDGQNSAIIRPVEFEENSGAKEAGVRGWYEAGTDTYSVYSDGVAERMDKVGEAMINLQIETMPEEEWKRANDSAKMDSLSKEELEGLIKKFEKIIEE
jgi:hypothetical protein